MELQSEDPSQLSKSQIHHRFSDSLFYKASKNQLVSIIGQGGIGSWVSLFIGRIGVTLNIWDYDTIEEHNIGGQFFSKKNIGLSKIDSIQELLIDFADNKNVILNKGFTPLSELTPVTICCPDNMETRKIAYEKWKELKSGIFIDARMTLTQFEVYTVLPDEDDYKAYENTLFPDSEAAELPCNEKSTSDVAAMCAATISNIIKNYWVNAYLGGKACVIPKKLFFHSEMLLYASN